MIVVAILALDDCLRHILILVMDCGLSVMESVYSVAWEVPFVDRSSR